MPRRSFFGLPRLWDTLVAALVMAVPIAGFIVLRVSCPLHEFEWLAPPAASGPLGFRYMGTEFVFVLGDALQPKAINDPLLRPWTSAALLVAANEHIDPPDESSLMWKALARVPRGGALTDQDRVTAHVQAIKENYESLVTGQIEQVDVEEGVLRDQGYKAVYLLALYDWDRGGAEAIGTPAMANDRVLRSMEEGVSNALFEAGRSATPTVFVPFLGTGSHLNLSKNAAVDSIARGFMDRARRGGRVRQVVLVGWTGWEEANRRIARAAFLRQARLVEARSAGALFHESRILGAASLIALFAGLLACPMVAPWIARGRASADHFAPWSFSGFIVWLLVFAGGLNLANDLMLNIFDPPWWFRLGVFIAIGLTPPIARSHFGHLLPRTSEPEAALGGATST